MDNINTAYLNKYCVNGDYNTPRLGFPSTISAFNIIRQGGGTGAYLTLSFSCNNIEILGFSNVTLVQIDLTPAVIQLVVYNPSVHILWSR